MKRRAKKHTSVLVVDVGGSHIKCISTGRKRPTKIKSGPDMTPERMMEALCKTTADWHFDAVSLGYPGVVRDGKIVREPHNLGPGWVDFDFEAAFGRPSKIINDAAMQALGGYTGGKMLFLGLGTGLGSALIVDGVVATMELGHLHYAHGKTYEDYLGKQGRKHLGKKKWRRKVERVVESFRKALLPDLIVLGGGNAEDLKRLPPQTRRGTNADAIRGGYRMWSETHAVR